MDGTHWGAVAAGIGGLATAGALLVSLALLRQQMRDQRQAQSDRHREHASHVAFWAELGEIDERTGDVAIVMHYANTSLRPVMNILMVAGIGGELGAGADHRETDVQQELVAIGPGDEGTIGFRLEGVPARC
jgi:hypothetical protein